MVKKLFNFSGRCPRREYWPFVAAWVAAAIGWIILTTVLGLMNRPPYVANLGLMAFFIPMTAFTWRRLQDIGWPGWIALPLLVPVVNVLVALGLFIPTLLPGDKDDNKYGPAV